MPKVDPHRLPATSLVRLVEGGELTSEAIVRSCLERTAEREPVVRAWSHLAGDSALTRARELDRARQKTLLGGVPFSIKDIFDTADMPTTYGSPIYVGCRPASDASAAALPRAAGGVLLGKTVTTEFANRHPGPTTNPHDPNFTPGGSSSGSAAAVADFMVPLAIGTQTGGSVIRPAAYCGVVGFKPSFGLFPPAGMRINTETLDTVGIMARSVGDIALFRAAMMAIPYAAPAVPQTAPRLGLCRGPHWNDAQPEGRAVLESAAERLAAAGAAVGETQLPAECARADEWQRVLGSFEGLRNHMPELSRHEALLSPELRNEKIALGRELTLDAFRAACRGAEKARRAAQEWASGFDAILTLPAPGQAPRGLADTGSAVFNAVWTQLYMPCLTLPAGSGPDGLPVGVQLVTRRHADELLLQVALWVEQRLGGKTPMSSPEHLTASEAVAQLTAGTLTAEALTRACLEQARAGAEIKAWAWLDPEQAMAQARAVDRAGRKGRLAGVPVGIKDIIDTVDMPTGHGSPIYPRHRPFADAACVALIRAASGVILGKTVTTEFANRHPGPTVHPHNAEHTPGGSSSGSAAAVADFQVPLALGTQTGGSVIRPAAFCGVIGYKPSFGEFSRVGVKMQCHNLDTLGIICRSLEDVALLRGVLLAQQPHRVDRASAAPRIGFCRTPAWEHADRDTHALLQRTAEVLAAAGAKVREIALAPADILDHHRRIFEFEAARNYAYEYEVHGEKLSPALREGLLAPGRALPLAAYIEAIETAEAFRRQLDDVFTEVDVLLAPSAPGEAPKGLGSTGDARFNAIWTLAWTPCVTLPAGNGRSGLPLGIQLIGPRFRDEALLDAAAWVEARLH